MQQRFYPFDIIDKKKKGFELSEEEIKYFLSGFINKEIPDYQMSALLMCLYLKGMSSQETAAFTDIMTYSGQTIDFERTDVIDKHSLGGVGDKASFVLAAIAAAAGVKVPMMAGRTLGHTGGTIDKVESIPGFKTDLSLEEFKNQVLSHGIALVSQTGEIAPADKAIYALRDVTATIDHIPLITASIMSKKLAEGAAGIVMDVKVGNGAFMKTRKDARDMAKSLIATAKRFNRKMVALITDMNQPLGFCVGNSLEIIESIETLKGRGPKDLETLSLELAAHMIHIGGKSESFSKAMQKAKEVLKSGKALDEFRKLIEYQGGNSKVIGNYDLLPLSKITTEVLSPINGYVKSFETEKIGYLLNDLGGGRKKKEDIIDHSVGFCFHKKIGDSIKEGESLVTIYHLDKQKDLAKDIAQELRDSVIKIAKTKIEAPELIYEKLES